MHFHRAVTHAHTRAHTLQHVFFCSILVHRPTTTPFETCVTLYTPDRRTALPRARLRRARGAPVNFDDRQLAPKTRGVQPMMQGKQRAVSSKNAICSLKMGCGFPCAPQAAGIRADCTSGGDKESREKACGFIAVTCARGALPTHSAFPPSPILPNCRRLIACTSARWYVRSLGPTVSEAFRSTPLSQHVSLVAERLYSAYLQTAELWAAPPPLSVFGAPALRFRFCFLNFYLRVFQGQGDVWN